MRGKLTKQHIGLILMSVVGIVVIGMGIREYSRYQRVEYIKTLKKTLIMGEWSVIKQEEISEAYKSVDLKTPFELARREISLVGRGVGSRHALEGHIRAFGAEVKSKGEVSLVTLGRGLRLTQMLYESKEVPLARVVMESLLGASVASYGEGLNQIKDKFILKAKSPYKVNPQQLEEVLSIAVINKTLELKQPVSQLVREMVSKVKWQGLSIGDAYILHLVALYMEEGLLTSGLGMELKNYWMMPKSEENYRLVESKFMYEMIEGRPFEQ